MIDAGAARQTAREGQRSGDAAAGLGVELRGTRNIGSLAHEQARALHKGVARGRIGHGEAAAVLKGAAFGGVIIVHRHIQRKAEHGQHCQQHNGEQTRLEAFELDE